jgi:site-specific DNA-methyltransferase (adenine-specific)
VATNSPLGRWPANLIHDGSDEVVGLMGSAARFFYCAKASKRDRDEGCEGLEGIVSNHGLVSKCSNCGLTIKHNGSGVGCACENRGQEPIKKNGNFHPTVKPTALMRYLCRLVTPPGGLVLDPFMGSGSTGKAAVLEGFEFIGIERDADYLEITTSRIQAAQDNKPIL